MSRNNHVTSIMAALYLGFMLAMTSGCGGHSASSNAQSVNRAADTTSIELPARLRASSALVSDGGTGLHGYVSVDGGAKQEMAIQGDQASFTISDLAVGNHTVRIEFEFNSLSYGTVALARYETSVNILEGSNSLPPIKESDYIWPDADKDGVSNYDELNRGSNPFEVGAAPVVQAVSRDFAVAGRRIKVSGNHLADATATAVNFGVQLTTTEQTDHSFIMQVPGAASMVSGEASVEVRNFDGSTTKQFQVVGELLSVKDVQIGARHACALMASGAVYCWGANNYGQLGNGSEVDSQGAVNVIGITNAKALALGANHSCALLTDNSVKCWGRNDSGQLGTGNTANFSTPVTVANMVGATALAAYAEHTCAITGGRVYCWGGNTSPVLTGEDVRTTPMLLPALVDAIPPLQISTGRGHLCALTENESIQCIGSNSRGQLGNGVFQVTPSSVWVRVSSGGIAYQVTAGADHTCASFTDGSASCWGENGGGQLGNNSRVDSSTPVRVNLSGNLYSIIAGASHTCAVTAATPNATKETYCWGSNSNYQLGVNDSSTDSLVPVIAENGAGAVAIAAGANNSCMIQNNTGSVYCWGLNDAGQQGNGLQVNAVSPATVTGITNAKQVSVAPEHVCVTTKVNGINCWGEGGSGQLGNGLSLNQFEPVTVEAVSNAVESGSGFGFSCERNRLGEVFCWGLNNYGQLGNGSFSSSNMRVEVDGVTALSLSVGDAYACAVIKDSSTTGHQVKCWGWNAPGVLGNGETANSNRPVDVVLSASHNLLTDAEAVGTGQSHACARLHSGKVKCWGANGSGQLGVSSPSSSLYPIEAAVLNSVVDISGGAFHSCAVQADHKVYCWGANADGQLGNGSVGSNSTPSAVSSITTATQVALGKTHSCARLSNGRVKCWGSNQSGQLGDGTKNSSAKPVTVKGIENAIWISSSSLANTTCAVLADGYVQCWGEKADPYIRTASEPVIRSQ